MTSEFERPFTVQVLRYGTSSKDGSFTPVTISLDPMRHTGSAVKEAVNARGLLLHAAQIVDDEALLKNFYNPSYPLVVVCGPSHFEESEAFAKNTNQLARLLNCGAPIELALIAAGRCYWQEGFGAFFEAATTIRQLVDSATQYDYQRRVEVACCSRRELNPVIVFNEYSGKAQLPPILQGDLTGGKFYNDWVDVPKGSISAEEQLVVREAAATAARKVPYLERCASAMVRVFGYHNAPDLEDPLCPQGAKGNGIGELNESAARKHQLRVVPFTAFFVAPDLLLASRTAAFCSETNTYAHKFKFTTRTRCLHGMLTDGEDLFDCHPIDGLTELLVSRVRNVGIALEDAHVPPGFLATPWNDFILLEVTNPSLHSQVYLLPEVAACGVGDHPGGAGNNSSNNNKQQQQPSPNNRRGSSSGSSAKMGDQIFAMGYGDRPSEQWLDLVFGPRGHNDPHITEAAIQRQWWGFHVKCAGVGVVVDEVDTRRGLLKHSASLLPGTRGGPLLRQLVTVSADDEELLLFAGVNAGRSLELLNRERDNIIEMSTSDLARRDSLTYNMTNAALPCQHLSLVLLYQEIIARRIPQSHTGARQHLRRFLAPYDVFVSKDILSTCHERMLKDAEDHNEYGMDFYDHNDLNNALACFREGAKMFSTASIPNLSEFQLELKDTLQTNVSAVVVAKMNPTD